MNALQQFLLQNNACQTKKVVNLGGRLKDYPLTIKAIDGDKYSNFQQMCIENPNSAKKRRFNTKRFHELICVECLVDPNLKDLEFIKAAGVPDSYKLLYKVFLSGEIARIAQKALEISGFDEDMEEETEEVKNS